MKLLSLPIIARLLAAAPHATVAHPGMEATLAEIRARGATTNQGTAPRSNELLGDLLTLGWQQRSNVGSSIHELLLGRGDPESDEHYWNVPDIQDQDQDQNSRQNQHQNCQRDACCAWSHVAREMETFFRADDGTCNKWARKAIRLAFHDAGTWSKSAAARGLPGGADGSIILSATELTRPANRGLADMGPKMQEWYTKYRRLGYQLGMADLIQLGSNVATVVCRGPRIRTYVGRVDNPAENADGQLPSAFATADHLIALFADKTIQPHGLVALLGAHTVSTQNAINATRPGAPQDSTPGIFDTNFFSETTNPPAQVFVLQSDVNLARDPVTSASFNLFSGSNGQSLFDKDYARESIRLALLGVNNINALTECSKVLPEKQRRGHW